jgi:hypothetical protein
MTKYTQIIEFIATNNLANTLYVTLEDNTENALLALWENNGKPQELVLTDMYVKAISPKISCSLTKLILTNTFLRRIPSGLHNLTHLEVKYQDSITDLPLDCTLLEYLDISESLIRSIPLKYTALKTLIATIAAITVVPDTLINLTTLNIQGSVITKISEKFTELVYLNVSNTNVETLPNTLVKLETLDIKSSYITEIPKELKALTNITCNMDQLPTLFKHWDKCPANMVIHLV